MPCSLRIPCATKRLFGSVRLSADPSCQHAFDPCRLSLLERFETRLPEPRQHGDHLLVAEAEEEMPSRLKPLKQRRQQPLDEISAPSLRNFFDENTIEPFARQAEELQPRMGSLQISAPSLRTKSRKNLAGIF